MGKKKRKSLGEDVILRELRRIRNLLMLALKNQGLKLSELSKVTGIDRGDISRELSTKKQKSGAKEKK